MAFGKNERGFLPVNYLNQVNLIIGNYPYGLSHGFQKDAIQNAVGARPSNKYDEWKCVIDVVTTKKGRFVIVEDFGTVGLTGPNYSIQEIQEHQNKNELDSSKRLARISSEYNSGGNRTGGGLFGIGKLVYSAASNENTCEYIYESLSSVDKEGYRLNSNKGGQIFVDGAKEGWAAKRYLTSRTGLTPINHVGTRIIIINPKDEIVDSIVSGEMAEFAAETWSMAISKCKGDSGIYINGKKVEHKDYFVIQNSIKERKTFGKEKNVLPGKTTLGFSLTVFEKPIEPERNAGIFYYRKDMRITKVPLSEDLERLIAGRYVGYIIPDEKWQSGLEGIEDFTHYGIKRGSHLSSYYIDLKKAVDAKVRSLLSEWGILKDSDVDERLNSDLLESIQKDIEDLFKESGYSSLASGEEGDDISFRLINVVYPNKEEFKTVHAGDKIEIEYSIKNRNDQRESYELLIESSCVLTSKKYEINKKRIRLPKGDSYVDDIFVTVDEQNSEKGYVNNITLSLVSTGGNKPIISKKLPFYFDIPTEKNPISDFDLTVVEHGFPKIASKTVDPDGQLTGLRYRLSNNTNEDVNVTLAITTHNPEKRNDLITEVSNKTYTIPAFSKILSDELDVPFDEEIYGKTMKKGPVEVRAVMYSKGTNGLYSDQEKLRMSKFTVLYNQEDLKGFDNSFKLQCVKADAEHEKMRSWSEQKGSIRYIYINTSYPEYKYLEGEDELQDAYLKKEAIMQFALVYLKENHFENLSLMNDSDKENPILVAEALKRKIDELWFKQCQK